jgi:homoserine kinase
LWRPIPLFIYITLYRDDIQPHMLYSGLMSSRPRTLRITVPATSANLGAGFDVLGLALDLHNVFVITEADTTRIEISGHDAGLPRDETNLFYRAFSYLYESAGRKAPPLHVKIDAQIPSGKGLGSSATAVVGGLVAANDLLGNLYNQAELLKEAVRLEHGGHADNVAPALMGGLVANVLEGDQVISLRVPFPEEIKAVLFMPDFPMDTVQGRALMPTLFPRADVVFNTSRVALFLAALGTGRYDLLRIAMQDKLHQPYRAQIFPPLPDLIQAALDAGAHGACLSGGGSSVLALATERWDEIGAAMMRRGTKSGLQGEARILNIDPKGAEARWAEKEDPT